MKLSNEMRNDLLVTALEGGSNYWYLLEDVDKYLDSSTKGQALSERIFWQVQQGGLIPVFDLENPEDILGYISSRNFDRADKMLGEMPTVQNNINDGNYDADDADIWFQFVVMGNIIYG